MTAATEPTRIERRQRLTQADFHAFAHLSGDHNPIHIDPAFAAQTAFGATVAHGMLLFTVLRGLVERHYPHTRLHAQEPMFPIPILAADGRTICTGRTLVLFKH